MTEPATQAAKPATQAAKPATKAKAKPLKSYRETKPPVPFCSETDHEKPPRRTYSAGEGVEACKEKDSHDLD